MQQATQADQDLQQLSTLVSHGFPEAKHSLPASLLVYWQYRDRLTVMDGVIMLDSRMVVRQALRGHILQALHSAHQGVSGMRSQAQETVFWPGMSRDIEEVHSKCPTCCRMAPWQPRLPPGEAIPPTYPFQAIAADYFSVQGKKYPVIVDRFSTWPNIMRATKSDGAAGSHGVIRNLKYIFATFGAPEELSSDGGPEFTAAETQEFLERWGVRHRLSAAYHPSSNGRAEVVVKSMKRSCKATPMQMVHWMIIVSWLGSSSTATPQSLPLACPQLWFCLADLYGTASQYPPKPAYSTVQGCPQCGMTCGAPVRRRWRCGLVSRQIPDAPTRTPSPHWSPNPGCWSRTNAALTQPNGTGLAAWSRRCPMTNTWSDWMDQVASQGATGNTSNAFTSDPVGGPIGPLQLVPALGAHVDPLQPACEGTQGAEHVHNPHPKGQAGPPPKPCPVSAPLPPPNHAIPDLPDTTLTTTRAPVATHNPDNPEAPVGATPPAATPPTRPVCDRRSPPWLKDYVTS